jgi:hypothetical protein
MYNFIINLEKLKPNWFAEMNEFEKAESKS